ncbi:hypothetical protein A0256_24445 [Mucilaginibacter sp. PAMC 26640]|nr:hypothetical protein A0256_24445 [Mucilaginibacter sp. PAMC 26640]
MIKKLFGALTLLLLTSFSAICQCTGDPNDPGVPIDPDDAPCSVPLDTWVIILVGIALIYAVYQLHKKQKAFSV